MKRDILTNNGMDIHLVRYFDYQGRKYLIFTRDGENESDDQGHVFVHIAEVNNLSATAVEGDTYETAKSVIKDIVMKNQKNIPLSINDLNYNELNGLNIISDKQLGLLSNYVETLKQNQPEFPETNVNSENGFEMPSFVQEQPAFDVNEQENVNDNNQEFDNPFNQFSSNSEPSNESLDTDYQKMYLEQVELVNKLNSEIEVYKNKLEMLKNIINN